MKKYIISAVCLATALASCNQIETPEYQAMSLDINVTTVAETKAMVSGSTLPSGSSVGLFLTDESGVTYDGVAVSNIRYTGTGEGASQQWSAQSDIMLSTTKGTLRGYYPYSESVTDISAISIQATSDVQDDWMWAKPVSNLNNKINSATLTMNHALAAVRLSIVRGSYSGVAEVTSVAFKSEGAATEAVLDATNGSLSSINGANTRYESTEVFTIGDEKKSFDFITVPAGVSAPVAIEVMVNGSKMVAESDAVLLETGNLYEYTLAVGTEGVFVNSMNVTEWSVEEKGTVKIEPVVPNQIIAKYRPATADETTKLITPPVTYSTSTCYKISKMYIDDIPTDFCTEYTFGDTEEHEVRFIFEEMINACRLFSGCNGLTYLDLSKLNTSQTIGFNSMLLECHNLHTINLDNCDFRNIKKDQDHYIVGTIGYPQNLSTIYMSNLILPEEGFRFTSKDNLNSVKKVIANNIVALGSMSSFLGSFPELEYLEIYNWDLSKCTSISHLFKNLKNIEIEKFGIENWDTGNIKSLYGTFSGCESIKNLDLRKWNVSNVTSMESAFAGCGAETINLTGWNTSQVTDMSYMFRNCKNLTNIIGISDLDMSSVEDMMLMFTETNVSYLDLSSWNLASATRIDMMFEGCRNLIELNLNNWNTSNIEVFNGSTSPSPFKSCPSLKRLYLENWDLSSTSYMLEAFSSCSSLEELDLSTWDFTTITKGPRFTSCSKLSKIILNSTFLPNLFDSMNPQYISNYMGRDVTGEKAIYLPEGYDTSSIPEDYIPDGWIIKTY